MGGSSWNVLQLAQDLMEPKPIVELHTFWASYWWTVATQIYFLATTIICSLSALNCIFTPKKVRRLRWSFGIWMCHKLRSPRRHIAQIWPFMKDNYDGIVAIIFDFSAFYFAHMPITLPGENMEMIPGHHNTLFYAWPCHPNTNIRWFLSHVPVLIHCLFEVALKVFGT